MHFDNLLFILLGLAFVVLRWLAQRATTSKREPPRDGPQRPTRAPAESEEERMRRFMEALGNPAGSKPPPKVTPRPVEPMRPVAAERERHELEGETKRPKKSIWTGPLPPLTTAPPPPAPLPPPTKTRESAKQKTARPLDPAPRFEVVEQSGPAPSISAIAAAAPVPAATMQREAASPSTTAEIQALLSSADGLRSAVLLREVLGAPRAFQPLEAF